MALRQHLLMYDFLFVNGGAEAVSLQLVKSREDMDLSVGFINSDNFPKAPLEAEKLISLGKSTRILGWQTIKTSWLFKYKTGFINRYEKVVFSGSNTPLAVHNHIGKVNILYCHTPPRFVYDLKAHYLSTAPLWQKILLKCLIAWFQPQYEKAIGKMDLVIANSRNVQERLKHYLGIKSIVIYPPCDTNKFKWMGQEDFYLSTARLEPYKRVDLIVEAFLKMPQKNLIIASGGSQLERLKTLAKGAKNIHFTGWCDQSTLIDLMGRCTASIYLPMNEDFGMSPVESMAAGKPVIGVAEGGILETIVENKTGVLCPSDPTNEDIINAVNYLSKDTAASMREDCEKQADKFSAKRFHQSIDALLDCSKEQLQDTASKVDATST